MHLSLIICLTYERKQLQIGNIQFSTLYIQYFQKKQGPVSAVVFKYNSKTGPFSSRDSVPFTFGNILFQCFFSQKDTSSCSNFKLGWGSSKAQVILMWTCGSGTDVHTLYDGDGRCENIVTRKQLNKGLSKEMQLVQQAMNFGYPRFSSCDKQRPYYRVKANFNGE